MKTKRLASFTSILLAILLVFIFLHRIRVKNFLSFSSTSPSLIQIEPKSLEGLAGERTKVSITLINRTKSTWLTRGRNPLYLSYHLLDQQQQLLQFNNERFPLPPEIKPGSKIKLTLRIRNPLEPGIYFLEFDLVKEGAFWFKEKGFSPVKVKMTISPLQLAGEDQPWTLQAAPLTKIECSSPDYSLLLKMIRLTLEKNKIVIKQEKGEIYGFQAGLNYPQIWIRDSVTLIPVVKYYFPRPYLFSWLEAFLQYQQNNGSLPDWIDPQGRQGKNTTETDQETSAVQAAWLLAQLTEPEWLLKKIQGQPLIGRLERALHFVLHNRWSPKFNLIRGAHTADWGDVDLVDTNQQAILTDHRTHWTVDIYDQAMFYLACQNLSSMFARLNFREKSLFWAKKAAAIKQATQQWLWDKKRGYFLIHRHCDSLKHPFEEKDILAVGGNTMAILAGLATTHQARSIIQAITERKMKYNLPTLSATLLPPYPARTFKHPLVDEPYEYQNGGQWDWWGGRLILALFEQGYSHQAKQALSEIIALLKRNRGLFEWTNREGTAQGSDYFAGSAGALGQALIEGYLGIQFTKDRINLSPRLDKDEVKVHLYLPATGQFLAYHYRYQDPGKIIFKYNSNVRHPGMISLLLPEDMLQQSVKVKLDGQNVPFHIINSHNDTYIRIQSDFLNHNLEIIKVDK